MKTKVLLIDCLNSNRKEQMKRAFKDNFNCELFEVESDDRELSIIDISGDRIEIIHFDVALTHAREKEKINEMGLSIDNVIYYGGDGEGDPDVPIGGEQIMRPITNENFINRKEAADLIEYLRNKNANLDINFVKPAFLLGSIVNLKLDTVLEFLHIWLINKPSTITDNEFQSFKCSIISKRGHNLTIQELFDEWKGSDDHEGLRRLRDGMLEYALL